MLVSVYVTKFQLLISSLSSIHITYTPENIFHQQIEPYDLYRRYAR